ncbi:MAG TPA: cytidylate kinase-like family protein [Verrucomicrobiae bacterium]
MKPEVGLERCLSFINCQLQGSRGRTPAYRDGEHKRAVTISRQAGSGAHMVAAKLAELLQAQEPPEQCPWAVFDRNLVEKVLEDHNLPSRLAKFMPEDKISGISDTMDELFGLHPPSWTLVHKTAETILHLADLGNVIIIGRGAALITAKLDYVFHVRLVGSVERRAQYLMLHNSLPEKAALDLVQQEDQGRKRYLKKYFDKDVDDPLLYHLTINTDVVPYEEAARIIAGAVATKPAGA